VLSKAVRYDPNNPWHIIPVLVDLNELRYRRNIDRRASWIAEWGELDHLSREWRTRL
jgi:hypothetical protein